MALLEMAMANKMFGSSKETPHLYRHGIFIAWQKNNKAYLIKYTSYDTVAKQYSDLSFVPMNSNINDSCVIFVDSIPSAGARYMCGQVQLSADTASLSFYDENEGGVTIYSDEEDVTFNVSDSVTQIF